MAILKQAEAIALQVPAQAAVVLRDLFIILLNIQKVMVALILVHPMEAAIKETITPLQMVIRVTERTRSNSFNNLPQ